MFAGKKSAQIREILISESAWEEMTCLFAPSLAVDALYQIEPFADASERLSCLLARYEKLVAADEESEPKKPVKKSKNAELQSKD